ncbi:M15 family metallopeptidase [Myxococcaceae bacterium GXIMD 01537]
MPRAAWRWLLAAALAPPGLALADEAPPPGLSCLARYYAGTPERREDTWGLALPGGAFVPWDDGRTKRPEERLAEPDLEDMLAQPYVRGPIGPVTREGEDPGRVRVEALFRAAYGERRERVDVVDFPFFGRRLKVHRRALPAFERVRARLEALVAREPDLRRHLEGAGGTFNWRPIAGTTRLSAHAFGVSLDLNTARADYWQWQRPPGPPRWRNRVPLALVEAFEAEGFIWGGRWYHYDTMHFEWRPELFDANCRPTQSLGG